MKKIAIIYHSGYGHTETLANSIAKGANSVDDTKADLFKTQDLKDNLDQLQDYDAMIFGSPTYMGSVSAEFKAFMEESSKIWFNQGWKDKIAAGFTNSHSLSGDKLNSLMQLAIFAAQHSMIWVSLGELNKSPDGQAGKEDVVNRIGSSIGLMAQSENDSPENTPPQGDHETAKLLGIRVAEISHKMK